MEWVLIVLIRLLIPLTILRWNLAGSILAILADNFDVVILDMLGVSDYGPYNRVDKFLDTYMYLIQGYTILHWGNLLVKKIGLSLLIYRLIGVVLYEISDLRALLFIFPNLFIFFYMYYLIYKKIRKKEPFTSFMSAMPVLVVLLIVKLFQEYMLHVAQFPIYGWLREHVFTFL